MKTVVVFFAPFVLVSCTGELGPPELPKPSAPPVCGNRVTEAPETCDGECPTTCDDGNACTMDVLVGSAATCDARCRITLLTACVDADGCCPSSCTHAMDSDCADTTMMPPPPPPPPSGHTWYVSKTGSNADGRTWATAWNELDQIGWSSVLPGDHIELEGGTYTTRLVLSKPGTAGARITLERSTETGHDGKVTLDFTHTPLPSNIWDGFVRVASPYITIDGKDWTLFDVTSSGGFPFLVTTGTDADYFQLANVRIFGDAPFTAGSAIIVQDGSLAVDHVWFGTQIGSEDHIKMTSATGSLRIEHSVFTPWISIMGSHSDLVEGCAWDGVHPCQQGDLTFRHNLVWDSGTGGGNICFEGPDAWNHVDISYNVFKDVFQVFQGSYRGSRRISNNVFYDVGGTVGGMDPSETKNNIFVAPASNTGIVWGTSPSYSLWGPMTYGYFSGGGTNLQADPMFLDPTAVLGSDGLAFTADDGFNVRAGSPAIDHGDMTVDSDDIRGLPLVGAPDIGAYEVRP